MGQLCVELAVVAKRIIHMTPYKLNSGKRSLAYMYWQLLSDHRAAIQALTRWSLGSCGACHSSSRGGGDIREFAGVHAGSNPRTANACNICHTSVSTDTSKWPHSFQRSATQGTGSARRTEDADLSPSNSLRVASPGLA